MTDTRPDGASARSRVSPAPELVAHVRRRYAAGVPVADILDESGLSLGVLYLCLDGVFDDGSGRPLERLPRRSNIKRRRAPQRHLRATLVATLWRVAQRKVEEIEKRAEREDLPPDEREGDARVLAIMVRALGELKAADAAGALPRQPLPTPASEDDDPVPRDIDEFRRRLADKIDAIAAADAAEGAGKDSA